MRFALRILALALMLGFASSPARAQVQLTIQNGRVSLDAKDATVRQILAEWAKVGQTKIVNAERVSGGPLTLQLANVPEQQALDILLRSASGYMAAPRAVAVANASQFDRILVMPTSVAPAAAAARLASPPPPAFPPPGPAPFQQTAQPPGGDDQDDDRPPAPVPNGPRARGPLFNAFPPLQGYNPQQAPDAGGGAVSGLAPAQGPLVLPAAGARATAVPSVPVGVAVPGMVVPGPVQTGQPASTPPQPTRDNSQR